MKIMVMSNDNYACLEMILWKYKGIYSKEHILRHIIGAGIDDFIKSTPEEIRKLAIERDKK